MRERVRPWLYGGLMAAFAAGSMAMFRRLRGGAGRVTGIFYGLVFAGAIAGLLATSQDQNGPGSIAGMAVGAGLGLGFAALAPLLRW
jgi:hypothetical protein